MQRSHRSGGGLDGGGPASGLQGTGAARPLSSWLHALSPGRASADRATRDGRPRAHPVESASAIILPEQFFAGPRSDRTRSGEKALHLAVCADGICCFTAPPQNRHEASDRRGMEAEAWIRAGDEASPFSCVNGCERLGVDPDALRAAPRARETRGRTTSG